MTAARGIVVPSLDIASTMYEVALYISTAFQLTFTYCAMVEYTTVGITARTIGAEFASSVPSYGIHRTVGEFELSDDFDSATTCTQIASAICIGNLHQQLTSEACGLLTRAGARNTLSPPVPPFTSLCPATTMGGFDHSDHSLAKWFSKQTARTWKRQMPASDQLITFSTCAASECWV